MDNIYSQSEFERNSIVELPDGFAKDAGNVLYSWLGSLWKTIHRGDDMVRGLQQARGMRLAQLYLDILEYAKLQDRNGAPVFHRDLWHPIVIRSSERDASQENMLRVGMNANIGPQLPDSDFDAGTVLEMGRLAEHEKYVTYPIHEGVVGMAASIVDNIVNPAVSMEHDVDFVFRNNSMIFPRDKDPLGPDSPFEKYDVPTDNPEEPDVECVLWASDVLVDRNYIADHVSYALGADAPSSDVVKRIVNAAWSSVASGLTPELIKTLVAAMLNIPVVQNERETVVDLYVERDEHGDAVAKIVKTDKCTYRVSMKAALRRDVFSGAELRRGDLLDESLRIYPYLNKVSEDHGSSGSEPVVTYEDTGFSVPLEQDIASVVLPSDILRVRTKHGLYSMWGMSEIKRSADGNANHLYFDVGGDPDDVSAFWHDVWSNADASGAKMYDLLGKRGVGDLISPAAYFLRHLVGANTIFVVVDESQIDDASKMHDPMFFGMLTSAVPSAIRLFVIEHRSVSDEADLGGAEDGASLSAELPRLSEAAHMEDCVGARFVRPSPPRKKGRKDEE